MRYDHAADHDADATDVRGPHGYRRTEIGSVSSGPGNQAIGAMLAGQSPPVHRHGPRSQGAGPLDPEIGAEIRAAHGSGQPIEDGVRSDMEGHLGVDLSAVRVHTDGSSDHLGRSVQADAFTTGTDVFFRSGRYQPASTDGRRLLAHELTHVVQQGAGLSSGSGRVSHPDDAHEVEARAVADGIAATPAVQRSAAVDELEPADDSAIDREEEPEEEPEEEEPEEAAAG